MAGASLGTASGRIEVDASQAISSINQVGSALSGLDAKSGLGGAAQGMSQLNQQAVNLGQGMQHLGRVGVGLGIAMAAPFVGAGKAALDFESSMAGVNAVMDITSDQFDQLSELAQQLGADTIFSGNEAAQGIETLGKAGISFEDIVNGAAEAATYLAAAGGVDVPQAAEVMSAAMAAFNVSGEDSIRVADALAGAANVSLSDINQLGIGLGQVGGIAAAANMSLEETVAFIALMADNGVRGSDAATSMKTAILALLSPTDKAATKMDEMGISLLDVEGNFVGLEGASRQFFDVWKDSGKTMSEFLDPLEDVLGRDAVRAILFGMQAIEEGINGTGKSFEDYMDAVTEAGAAQEFADKRMDSTAGAIERLTGSMETLAERAGKPLIEAIRGPIEALDQIVDAIGQIPGPILGAVTAVGALVAAFVTLGSGAVLVGGYILEGMARLSAAGIALDSVVATSLRVIAVFSSLIAIAAALKIAWDTNFLGFRDTLIEVGDALQALLDKMQLFADINADASKNTSDWGKIIDGWGHAIDQVIGTDISGFLDRVADAVDYVDTTMKRAKQWDIFFAAAKQQSKQVTELAKNIHSVGNAIDTITGNVLDVSRFFNAAADAVDTFTYNYLNWKYALGASEVEAILIGIGAAIQSVFGDNAVSQGIYNLVPAIKALDEAFWNATNRGLNPAAAALSAISAAAQAVGLTGLGVQFAKLAGLAQQFGNIVDDVFNVGQSANINGVSSALLGIAAALETIFGIDSQPIADFANAIDLLSKRWQAAIQEGANPFQAALAGIDGFLDSLLSDDQMNALDSMSESIQNATTAIGDLIGSGLDRVAQLFDEVGAAISRGDFSGVADAIGSLVEDVTGYDWGTLAQNVANGIAGAIGGIGDILGPAAQNLADAVGAALGEAGSLIGDISWGDLVSAIGNGISSAFDTIGPWVAGIAGSIANGIRDALGQVSSLIGGVSWGEIVSSIGSAISSAFNAVGPWVASVAGSIADGLRDALGEVGNLIGGINWSGVVSAVGTSISDAFSIAGTWLSGVTSTIRTQLESAVSAAGDTAVTLGNWFVNVVAPQLDGVVRDFGGWLQLKLGDLVSGAGQISEDFSDWVINLTVGEENVVLDALPLPTLITGAIGASLGELAGEAASFLDTPDVQASADSIGRSIGEGLLGLIAGAIEAIPDLFQLNGAIILTIGNIARGIFEGFFDAFDAAITQDTPAGGRPGGAAGANQNSIADRLVDSINAMIDGALSAIPDIMGAIPNKILEAMGVKNPFTGIKEQLDAWINEAFPSTPGAAGGIAEGGSLAAGVDNIIGGYEAPIEQGIENGNLRLVESANRKLEEGDIWGALQDTIGSSLLGQIGGGGPGADAAAAPSSSELAESWFSPVENNIPPAIDEGMESIGQGAEDAIKSSDVGTNFGTTIDSVLASNIGDVTLQEFSRQIGLKISEAMIAGLSASGGDAVPGSTGTTPITGIGEQIASALNSSLASADFSEVGSTIQTKISQAISTGLSSEGAAAGGAAGDAAGGIGASVANALAGSIGSADFAAVGAALQAKIGASLLSGVAEGGQGAGGQVAGAAGGLGASIAQGLASSIGTADFSAVGAAIQAKISEAVTAGQSKAEGGASGGGAGAGIGASIASAISDQISGADFSAVGEAIASQIGASLGTATGSLQEAMGAVISAVVASASQQASQAQVVGTEIVNAIGSGIGPATGTITAAVQAAVNAGIDAGLGVAPRGVEIGTQLVNSTGEGVGSATATATGAVEAMVSAAVDAGVSASSAAVEIGTMIATHAGSGAAAATELNGAVETMVSAAIDAGVGAAAGASVIGTAIADGAAAGIRAAAGRVAAEAVAMVNNAISEAKNAADISSPSKVAMDEIGRPIAEGVMIGIRKEKNNVSKAIRDLVNNALNFGTLTFDTGLFDGLLEIADQLSNTPGFEHIGNALELLGGQMKTTSDKVNSTTSDLIDGLTGTLQDGVKQITSISADMAKQLRKGFGTGIRDFLSDQFVDTSNIIAGLDGMENDVQKLIGLGQAVAQQGGMEAIGQAIIDIANNIELARSSALAEAQDMLAQIEALFISNEQKIRKAAKKAGQAPGDEISKKIRSDIPKVEAAASEMTTAAAKSMESNLDRLIGIAQQFGANVSTGITTGTNSVIPDVMDAGESLTNGYGDGLNKGLDSTYEDARGVVGEVRETFEEGSSQAIPDVTEAGKLLGESFGEGLSSIESASDAIALVSQLHSGITQAVQERLGSLMNSGKAVGDAFASGIDAVNPTQKGSSLVTEATNGVTQATPVATGIANRSGTKIGDSLADGIDSTCGDVNSQANSLTDSCIPDGIEAGEKVAIKSATTASENVSDAVVDGLEIKKNEVKGKFDAAGTLFGKAIGTGIGSTPQDAVNAAKSVSNKAGSVDGTNDGKSVGKSIAQGIAQGINENTGFILDAVKVAIDKAKKKADDEAKAKSPSRLFMETGESIALGLALGIDNHADRVASSAADLVNIVNDTMSGSAFSSTTRAFDLSLDRYSKNVIETMNDIDGRASRGSKMLQRESARRNGSSDRNRDTGRNRPDVVTVMPAITVGNVTINPGDPGYDQASSFIEMLQETAGQY